MPVGKIMALELKPYADLIENTALFFFCRGSVFSNRPAFNNDYNFT
jgi:hypothetical protein